MTIINVDKIIHTNKREFSVNVECLRDNNENITTGKIACFLNNNFIWDIQEVKTGENKFNLKIPESLKEDNEYFLKFHYGGSTQADEKCVSSILLFNREYKQDIEAEIIADDYYCNQGDVVEFTSYIKTKEDIAITGNFVLKMNGVSIGTSKINEGYARVKYEIPDMNNEKNVLFWKYATNHGIFINSCILHLPPRIDIVSKEYPVNNGVTEEIRQILNNKNNENNFIDKIKKIF